MEGKSQTERDREEKPGRDIDDDRGGERRPEPRPPEADAALEDQEDR